MVGEEPVKGIREEHGSLISALYHLLKGVAMLEKSIHDAQEAGDQELVQFFKDWQDEQRHFAERAKNLLGSRMAFAAAGARGEERGRAVTNASIRSGGNEGDDIVDEQSKESFPASDSPASY